MFLSIFTYFVLYFDSNAEERKFNSSNKTEIMLKEEKPNLHDKKLEILIFIWILTLMIEEFKQVICFLIRILCTT